MAKTTKSDCAVNSSKATAEPTGKLGVLLELLKASNGATLVAMCGATGWQAHSVRGAMSGALKRKHGFSIQTIKVDGVRRYWIDMEA